MSHAEVGAKQKRKMADASQATDIRRQRVSLEITNEVEYLAFIPDTGLMDGRRLVLAQARGAGAHLHERHEQLLALRRTGSL